jgi:hypothetical protein
MKRIFPLFLVFFLAVFPALAAKGIGEGYARPMFRELSQTITLMGGLDTNDTKVADEYIRLVYCGLYKQNFMDDLSWDKIRKEVMSRILEKKEYFRVLYEVISPFRIERYDFDTGSFPMTRDTAMINVGSIVLVSGEDFQPYCGLKKAVYYYPPNINLLLTKPLTIDKFPLPEDRVQDLLARMDEMKNMNRQFFGRIRFRITDIPGLVINNDNAVRSEMRGEVLAVDFFLDRDLTKPIGRLNVKTR